MRKLSSTLFAALSTIAVITASLSSGLAHASAPVPSLTEGGFASGPFSKMHLLLEKTFLNIDIVTVDIRVDAKAQGEFSKIAQGKKIEGDVEEQLARAALLVDNAVVQMMFERDVSLNQWLEQVVISLDKAVAAGYINAAGKTQVTTGLPTWFAPIKERGFKKGDKLLYRIRKGSLRTALLQADGQVPIDQTDKDGQAPKILFAGYFAPGADMRPLLRSLPNN
jgi:hypothetical protein